MNCIQQTKKIDISWTPIEDKSRDGRANVGFGIFIMGITDLLSAFQFFEVWQAVIYYLTEEQVKSQTCHASL